ncbi:ATP-binding protein [Actinomycetospora sp. C-140]
MGGALLSPTVVGRAEELRALRAALDEAARGRGSTIVLTGEPGVGKSRLLRELRSWCAQTGAVALVGRAVETATAAPFRPVVEALMSAYRQGATVDDPEVAPFRGALAGLVPDGATEADVPAAAPARLLSVAEGFLRVLRQRARAAGAAVVLFDDLHWADAETSAVVEYLADNLSQERILLVLAARPQDTGGVITGLRPLVDRRVAAELPLGRLGADEVVAMTRACLGDAAVPAEVLRLVTDRADGLPFFVEELLAGLRSDDSLVRDGDRWVVQQSARGRPPATFHDSVRARVATLAQDVQGLLCDAALLGRRVDPDLVATVTGTDRSVVEEMVRAAAALGLLVSTEPGVRFRHALIRDSLLADLTPGVCRARSAVVLARLRASCPSLPEDLVEVAADLAEAAGEHDVAAESLIEAGRRALERGALTTAETVHRRASALDASTARRLEATTALVTTLGLAGRMEDAFPVGEHLLAELGSDVPGADPEGTRRLAVHLALARSATAATNWRLAAAHLEPARALVASDVDAAGLEALQAGVALGEGRVDDASRHAVAAIEAAERARDADAECEARLVHGRCLREHDMDAAIEAFERARVVASRASSAHREARALAELGFATGYVSLDESALRAARALAEACGAPETEAVAENGLGLLAWTRADVAETLEHADAGLALARRYRLGQLVPALLIVRACGLALRGDIDAMEAVLAEAAPLTRGEPMEEIGLLLSRATAAFAVDDVSAVRGHLRRAMQIARQARPSVIPPMLVMHVLVSAVDGIDPRPLVAELAGWHTDSSRWRRGILAAAEAVRSGRSSFGAAGPRTDAADAPSGRELMDRALRDLDPAPFLRAVVARLVATTPGVDRWGDPSRWLSEAEAGFRALELPIPADACCAARARGGRTGGSALTPREEQVLALVAEGLANRGIARSLHLSERTVEKHVERLLAKTGSRNRAQLATWALRIARVRGADT